MFDEISINSTISNQSHNEMESILFFDEGDYQSLSNYDEYQLLVNNVISSVNLGKNLNLKNIALKIKNAEFSNNKLTLSSKSKNRNKIATIFSSGKMIISGAKTEKEAKNLSIKFSKIVNKAGGNVEFKDYQIQNIICSYDVKFKLSINKLYNQINEMINNYKKLNYNINDYCKMEENFFRGVIYYSDSTKITVVIYESGKISISGAKSRKNIEEIFKNIYPLLVESKQIIDSFC